MSEEFNDELTDEDIQELSEMIKNGNTSGRIDNCDNGYSISFDLSVDKFKN